MTKALTLEGVSKRYATHQAVHDLSLTVPSGTIYGILGPNGAGKSTTLRMVMNIIARDTGTILVLGEPSESRAILRRVGYLPEERGLYRRMSVIDVIVFFARLKGLSAKEAKRRAGAWLERMGLADWRHATVDTLSKGMQQKVQFITTVLHEPELLILDEPHSGLDPVNQEVLRETILATRAEGRTVVLSTHNMDQAEALCDSVCIIAAGTKVLDGAVRDVKRSHRRDQYRLIVDALTPAALLTQLESVLGRGTARFAPGVNHHTWDLELNGGSAQNLLAMLAQLPLAIERFELVEPTLHEIFIEKVGAEARHAPRQAVSHA
jgi:ABC-2 type transport system ATP-binding protein